MSTNYIHTLGDSTLDNLYWMLNSRGNNAAQAKHDSVEGQLQERLNIGSHSTYQMISHAYDGFTTSSILNGDNVGRVLSIRPGVFINANREVYLKDRNIDPISDRYFVHPLNEFKEFANKNSQATHYVVISVGGNDFRERLASPLALLREIPHVHQRYLQILKEVKSLKDRNIKPILMFQYLLDVNHDHYLIYKILKIVGIIFCAIHLCSFLGIGISLMALLANKINLYLGLGGVFTSLAFLLLSYRVLPLKTTQRILSGQEVGMATLRGLLEIFYKPILAQAKADGIPILDLSNTFNPNDSNLYISQIEPSQKGSALIAEGLDHIIKCHDFTSSKSLMYSKRNFDHEFIAIENPGFKGWSVAYPGKET